MKVSIKTVLIVDDEPLARRFIKDCLAPHKDMEVVAEAADGVDAVSLIEELEPDIVFLDIKMPRKGGLEVLKEIVIDNSPAVVFATAYDEFAVTAFEQEAVDYLLKPFCHERFDEALDRVRKTIASRQLASTNQSLRRLLRSLTSKEPIQSPPALDEFVIDESNQLRIKTSIGTVLIEPSSIDLIESDAYLLNIYTNTKRYSISGTMKDMEQCLNPIGFVRIHRKFIVGVSKIKSYKATGTGSYELFLKNGRKVLLSRRRRSKLDALIKQLGH